MPMKKWQSCAGLASMGSTKTSVAGALATAEVSKYQYAEVAQSYSVSDTLDVPIEECF
ncbi:hypothetical protein EMIT0P265_10666 [Pseudomonas zeae]